LKVEQSQYRPSLRILILVLLLMAAIVAIGVVFNQIVIATLATMLICGAVIAIWLARGRR
jgi:hypothetical protein